MTSSIHPAGPDGRIDDARWRAVLARDPRADGTFVYAVKTTGIYCRPVCPARRPRRSNVTTFEAARAAAERGYRACRLCRPDAGGDDAAHGMAAIRPAAVLFADVKGFSKLASTMSPVAALALAMALQGRLADAVRAHGGAVHKLLGDGLMAVFGVERSRASDAARALDAALAMRTSLADWNGGADAGQHNPGVEAGVPERRGPARVPERRREGREPREHL
ncbi:MAG TPA: Ada metal-binding domain-containing protein [Geminicoccaceae bacterium]